MKRIVIICGLISGAIVATAMTISTSIYCASGDFEGGMVVGYASMIIALSLVFVGIKNYRDKQNQGVISFGKAFKVGILISLIASTVYVIVWLVNYYFFIPDFSDKYAEHVMNNLKESGASQAEITKESTKMAEFKDMYKNPFFVILFTYLEILPVGLLVSLISALILKRKVAPVK